MFSGWPEDKTGHCHPARHRGGRRACRGAPTTRPPGRASTSPRTTRSGIGGGDFGHLAAYAWQAASGPLIKAPHVSVHAIINADPADALVMLRDPDLARALAALLDRLADVTPQQHRALAEQVRQAAAVLDGEEPAQ